MIQRRPLVWLTAATYVTSLALPAYVGSGGKSVYGAEVLVTGWMGIAAGEFRWLANLLLLHVLICTALDRKVLIPRFLGLLLGATALTLPLPIPPELKVRLAIGAYVWGASLLLAAALCYLPRAEAARG